MLKTRNVPAAIALFTGLGLVAAPSAAAASSVPEDTQPSDKEVCESQDSGATLTAVTSSEAERLIDSTLDGLENGQFTKTFDEKDLKSEEAVATLVESDGDEEFTAVTMPIGGDYSLTSNFTVLFDAAGSPVEYTETLVAENDEGNFGVKSYINGETSGEQDTGIAFMSDADLKSQDAPVTTAQSTAGCVAAVLGVGGGTAALIATLCTGACATAATGFSAPVCVACIGGYASVGGVSVTAIATCF